MEQHGSKMDDKSTDDQSRTRLFSEELERADGILLPLKAMAIHL